MTGLVRRFALGAAAPETFDLRNTVARVELAIFGQRDFDASSAKIAALDETAWPVRNQGFSRATCNAFAVVAAEEYFAAQIAQGDLVGEVPQFSEEYFYTAMRKRTQEVEVIISDTPTGGAASDANQRRKKIEEDGSTFLLQARAALKADGLLPRRLMEYDAAPERPPNHTVEIPARVKDEKIEVPEPFVHDIDASLFSEGSATDRVWKSGDQRPVSVRILDALQVGVPVVAAFALLDFPGDTAWYGLSAQEYGLVQYPADAQGMKVIGGHSVCIVNYLQSPAGPEEDMFVFRNSWGRHDFGSAPHRRPKEPRAPYRGYGLISAHDVDRFCWEFLHRALPEGTGDTI